MRRLAGAAALLLLAASAAKAAITLRSEVDARKTRSPRRRS